MLICPKCGAPSTEIEFIEPFCIRCYPVHLRIPRNITITQCKDCKKIKQGGDWVKREDAALAENIIQKCKGEFESAKYNVDRQEAVFTVKGKTIIRPIPLEEEVVLCPNCSRRRGGYYEAILQFRGPENRVKKHSQRAVTWLNKHSWVSKIDEHKDGIDVYVGSFQSAQQFVQLLGRKHTLTKKLVGRRKGKRIYRSTFAIRL